MENKIWKDKLSVLLHDPLIKAFDIKGHENLSKEFCDLVGVEMLRGEEDIVSSAFDRIPLPHERYGKQIRISIDNLPGFYHPISGKVIPQTKELYTKKKENLPSLINEIKRKLKALKDENDSYEKIYHALWWELAYILEYSGLLPADTRIPNHSIVDHLDMASALTSCVNSNNEIDASLVMFAIGPVQEVIAQARKTVDLWAGSYLLSYLTYQAIEYIGLTYGFDSIVYPYLRGNQFVYKTLERHGVKLLTKPIANEKVASIPNVFLAIVPISDAKKVIDECSKKVKEKWEELSNKTLGILKKESMEVNEQEYKKQMEIFPTVNATFMPLPKTVEQVKTTIETLFEDEDFIREIENYEAFVQEIEKLGGYKVNAGSFYRHTFKTLTARLNAIKAISHFPMYESDAMIDGQRIPDDFGGIVRACVKVKDQDKEDYLGTLNATKRFLRDTLRDKLIEKIRYESLQEMAAENEVNKKEGKMVNGYVAVLMLDGDRMGKLVSGDEAPEFEKIAHERLKEVLESEQGISEELRHEIYRQRMLTPSYQKAISRMLGIFSSLVSYVVEEKYNGMLVYAGGDDVLAILPADKVLQCANDIRKMYSGIGGIEINVNGDTYKFEHELLYKNGEPIALMMGDRATMSAGISIAHHKVPLKTMIELARQQEHRAKERLGRNAFSVAVVRRSGQIEEVGAKWEIDGMDVIKETVEIYELSEALKMSHRTFYKLTEDDIAIVKNSKNDVIIEKIADYLLRRSDAVKKDSEDFKELALKFKHYIKILLKNDKVSLRRPFDLILTVRLTKRGDKRGDN
ncbi:type III-B CRISPR-associated protein Cas10/Cmr2 [Fervidobacterium riparium]